jgi:hypothetical protein
MQWVSRPVSIAGLYEEAYYRNAISQSIWYKEQN